MSCDILNTTDGDMEFEEGDPLDMEVDDLLS